VSAIHQFFVKMVALCNPYLLAVPGGAIDGHSSIRDHQSSTLPFSVLSENRKAEL